MAGERVREEGKRAEWTQLTGSVQEEAPWREIGGTSGLREDRRMAAKTGQWQAEAGNTQIAQVNPARDRRMWKNAGGEQEKTVKFPAPDFNRDPGYRQRNAAASLPRGPQLRTHAASESLCPVSVPFHFPLFFSLLSSLFSHLPALWSFPLAC